MEIQRYCDAIREMSPSDRSLTVEIVSGDSRIPPIVRRIVLDLFKLSGV